MKTKLILYPAIVGMLFVACGESEKDSYTDAMQDEVATKGPLDGDDINMKKLEDAKPLGQHELVDTLQLPEPLIVILQKDPATSLDKIKDVRRFTEDAIEYFEITFDNPVQDKQVITYDNLGRIKSPK
ncbi:hypothetical protein J0A67_20450 [Algoriphagus aestuariicola]|jgi:hypothetical protein|uniref:Lipoprotein n=1 Tax=Algoriphagus aestuariicola TaxID=1852016 RepID=A0ABS3BVY4_9BACT|nr:hypothetical protein [Algoriphagus aestuariicola]MBN7803258.1 hypothetical protein [Algoriphagus aestuariicola]